MKMDISIGSVDLDALNTDQEIRTAAQKLVPDALREMGKAAAEVTWNELQKAFRGPGLKASNSASDKRKFVENAGKEYARKASQSQRREVEDHIVKQIVAKKASRSKPTSE